MKSVEVIGRFFEFHTRPVGRRVRPVGAGNYRADYDADGMGSLYLFGKLVAKWVVSTDVDKSDEVWITDAGWRTPTTKETLNVVLDVAGSSWRIGSKRFSDKGKRETKWVIYHIGSPTDKWELWEGSRQFVPLWTKARRHLPLWSEEDV